MCTSKWSCKVLWCDKGDKGHCPICTTLWCSSGLATRNSVLDRPFGRQQLLSCCSSQGSCAFQALAKPTSVFLLQISMSAAAAAGKGGANLPWPWHRRPGARWRTRQLHCLCAQRDFHPQPLRVGNSYASEGWKQHENHEFRCFSNRSSDTHAACLREAALESPLEWAVC